MEGQNKVKGPSNEEKGKYLLEDRLTKDEL